MKGWVMGIIPLFDWGEANALFFIKKFTLINKAVSRIKVFEPFEYSSNQSSIINAILISYVCVSKRLSKPVMKFSRVESIEVAIEQSRKLIKEVSLGKTNNRFNIKKNGE